MDEGGLMLVVFDHGHATAAYLEVGGYDDPADLDSLGEPGNASPTLPHDPSIVPDFAARSKALENPTALRMCFEAIGYVRGYCDAARISSSHAIDFGHALAVLSQPVDHVPPSTCCSWGR
ncbi:hypothetical protein IU450_36250 [Nocardia abscessus]|uniref:hypothetical protein n=1 Tax=Nocardia abscessus TaxID=120957 RepID=UPI001894343F|nr:hypothetical protein [Nocardia abscessus]MBF6341295.1 hypothetical protein [Nocardia abscessus]